MSGHDDLIREALAAERAAAYAQLDPDEFEECIEATDSALAALEADYSQKGADDDPS